MQKDEIEEGIYRLRESSFSSYQLNPNDETVRQEEGWELEKEGNKELEKEKGIMDQESDGTKDQKVT